MMFTSTLEGGVPLTRYNQAQEVAVVTADKLSKPVPTLFHPQDSGVSGASCKLNLLHIRGIRTAVQSVGT